MLHRKNSLSVGNQRGGHTAVILVTLTSTCRQHEVDPQHYLADLLTKLAGTPTGQLEQWLPDHWKAAQPQPMPPFEPLLAHRSPRARMSRRPWYVLSDRGHLSANLLRRQGSAGKTSGCWAAREAIERLDRVAQRSKLTGTDGPLIDLSSAEAPMFMEAGSFAAADFAARTEAQL